MKVALDTPIKDMDGEAIKDGEMSVLTLAKIAVNALLTPDKEDTPGIEKARRFKLAMRMHEGGEQSLTAEEITSLKNMIGKVYPPLVVGRAFELLDPE